MYTFAIQLINYIAILSGVLIATTVYGGIEQGFDPITLSALSLFSLFWAVSTEIRYQIIVRRLDVAPEEFDLAKIKEIKSLEALLELNPALHVVRERLRSLKSYKSLKFHKSTRYAEHMQKRDNGLYFLRMEDENIAPGSEIVDINGIVQGADDYYIFDDVITFTGNIYKMTGSDKVGLTYSYYSSGTV